MSNTSIVIGMGFGDEGKGAFVSYLCSKAKNPLVVRFNGGHQAGHTVVVGDKRHVFSNFGSGTLLGAPTYWSKYCTVNPIGISKEGNALRAMGVNPQLFIDANAMITTPFDILRNIKLDELNLHGTVGVGFGTTLKRNEDYFHLYVRDLKYPQIRNLKLKLLQEKYYGYVCPDGSKTQKMIDDFKIACEDLVSRYSIVDSINDIYLLGSCSANGSTPSDYFDLIFEGGQGIMLDMDYGFFPHVTRSNCTSKNALDILKNHNIGCEPYFNTYYVTRAYQTRHGNGPMTNEGLDISYIKINPLETNVNDGWQGIFRRSVLDISLLRYAVDCDTYHNPKSRKNIVVTCLDQVPNDVPVTGIGGAGRLTTVDGTMIGSCVGVPKQFCSYSDKGVD